MIIRIAILSVLLTLTFSIPNFANAGPLKMSPKGPTTKELNVVRARIDDFLFTFKGVNGTGETACEVNSGIAFYELTEAQIQQSEFVNCLQLTFDNRASKKAFEVLLPSGTAFEKVYISAKYVGKISAQ